MHSDDRMDIGALNFGGPHTKKLGHVTPELTMENIGDLFFATRGANDTDPTSTRSSVADASGAEDEFAISGSMKDGLANNVNDFLDDFLLLTGGDTGGVMAGAMDISDEDLLWIQGPDGFPAINTSSSASEGAVVVTGGDTVTVAPTAGQAVQAAADVSGGSDDGDATAVVAAVGVSPVVAASIAPPLSADSQPANPDRNEDDSAAERREKIRRQKVSRYLEKKRRRIWSRAAPYKSRQRVANSRPRHKGRFLALESDFVPIAELQRRQRALFKQMQMKQASPAPPSTPVPGEAGGGAGAGVNPGARSVVFDGNEMSI